ncbi:hypothetical protein [Entomobacter blattae]|uniref:hypothetical protein n=1 Tax=Entomobacter blattae TaxID=2762277 RepID=UPI00193C23E9|nr:hypothetical protein [Entomobacter blattae]
MFISFNKNKTVFSVQEAPRLWILRDHLHRNLSQENQKHPQRVLRLLPLIPLLPNNIVKKFTALYGNFSSEESEVIISIGGDGFMLETLHKSFFFNNNN